MNSQEEIRQFFKEADPVIFAVLATADVSKWKRQPLEQEKYFYSLVNQIVSQQLSTKVADVISERIEQLIGQRPFLPSTFLGTSDEDLRSVGLSRAKISYIKNLATKIIEKDLRLDLLPTLTEEEVIAELTKVKGIGKWTAEMFLMFSLGKEDVFSYGDWGLKSAMKKVYNLSDYPSVEQAEEITRKWKPFRSYGSFALWHSLE